MKVLLDTHAVIWAVEEPGKLGANAKAELSSTTNDLLISAATIWEIAIKVGLGKLNLSLPYLQWMNKAIADLDATVLPITVDYADSQAKLPHHHGDPFDRLLVAQAQSENVEIVSGDVIFDAYGLTRIW